jgi:hypothetical protein
MSDMAENMEALKRSFFIRGFFKTRGFYDLDNLTVADYREGKLAKNKLRKQAWIDASELFANTPGGSEKLATSGKERLNVLMAEFQGFFRNSVVIVEGYSGKGTPVEQFLRSPDRAFLVRDYLLEKFRLDPNYVGTEPMGASTGKDSSSYSEGVSGVVFYSKPH